MALMKGWKEHTWWRVKQLENDPSGLWVGIQAEFLKEIENAKRKIRDDEKQQANRNSFDTQT
jgi:hypothetical protein